MDDVDDFLMHYGVKGMKWGRRKTSSQRTPEEQAARRAKIKQGVAIAGGVALVAGVAAATIVLSKNGNKPMSQASSSSSSAAVRDMFKGLNQEFSKKPSTTGPSLFEGGKSSLKVMGADGKQSFSANPPKLGNTGVGLPKLANTKTPSVFEGGKSSLKVMGADGKQSFSANPPKLGNTGVGLPKRPPSGTSEFARQQSVMKLMGAAEVKTISDLNRDSKTQAANIAKINDHLRDLDDSLLSGIMSDLSGNRR